MIEKMTQPKTRARKINQSLMDTNEKGLHRTV